MLFPLMTREAVATLTLAPDAISRSPTFPFLEYSFFMFKRNLRNSIDRPCSVFRSTEIVETGAREPGEARLSYVQRLTIKKILSVGKKNSGDFSLVNILENFLML